MKKTFRKKKKGVGNYISNKKKNKKKRLEGIESQIIKTHMFQIMLAKIL